MAHWATCRRFSLKDGGRGLAIAWMLFGALWVILGGISLVATAVSDNTGWSAHFFVCALLHFIDGLFAISILIWARKWGYVGAALVGVTSLDIVLLWIHSIIATAGASDSGGGAEAVSKGITIIVCILASILALVELFVAYPRVKIFLSIQPVWAVGGTGSEKKTAEQLTEEQRPALMTGDDSPRIQDGEVGATEDEGDIRENKDE